MSHGFRLLSKKKVLTTSTFWNTRWIAERETILCVLLLLLLFHSPQPPSSWNHFFYQALVLLCYTEPPFHIQTQWHKNKKFFSSDFLPFSCGTVNCPFQFATVYFSCLLELSPVYRCNISGRGKNPLNFRNLPRPLKHTYASTFIQFIFGHGG